MKKYLRTYLAALLVLIFILCGCRSSAVSAPGEIIGNNDADKFEAFTRQLFVDTVSSDALTLHYELVNPSSYNINLDEINLGRIDFDSTESDTKELKDTLRQLHSFNYNKLAEQQQLTYDILDQYIQTELSADSSTLFFYPENLSSTSGIHSMLPVLMAEYQFYSKEDIDTYLALLKDFPAYFNNILDFQQKKSEAGLFMSDEAADDVIEACEELIKNPEENILITIFSEKLDTIDNLSDDDKATYIEENKSLVLDCVIPAYETLIDGLEALKGTGTNENGLYYFEHGKEYYEYLAKTQTGSERTPDEMIELVDNTLNGDLIQLAYILMANEELLSLTEGFPEIELNDPNEILETLQESLTEYFPEAITDKYSLKYVPEPLEESLNPAFYMIPPVDAPDVNSIYINSSQISDNLSLFTTLAHEGYPGHMYQYNYFSSTEPDPIRHELSFLGYAEGWATYVENISYEWTGLDDTMAKCLQLNQEMTLCMYARIDLGIHYEGWTEADVLDFLKEYGIEDAETVHEVFIYIVSSPAAYLPYCIGSLEFMELREQAEDTLGDNFNLKDFHEYLLNLGPCQFKIIDKYMKKDLLNS